MSLPAPSATYEQSNEAQARSLIENALASLEGDVQVLRDAQPAVQTVVAMGPVTVAAPRATGFFVLDVSNSTGGAVVVTLDPIFLGTFPGPSAGKRRTQMYWYDRGAGKFVPVGAQSPDL